ncbi:MAG: molybdopterin biosynthesis protein MoeA [Synergistaceae bacterium]|jgi:putative molybdopterin biosynthesis protein|nr:molybdopterin biosynthesis protein MoeA [Synergistaceae bacterium]
MAVVNERAYPEHCSLEEALRMLLDEFPSPPMKIVEIDVRDSTGLILAEDISSLRNVPHYTASAVDGYAVMASSTAGATTATPVILGHGSFSWVNTGMPVADADAVVMVEDTSLDGTAGEDDEKIKIFRCHTQGENVRAIGEDVMNGQRLACKGDRVTPALSSLLLCAGIERVSVHPRPRTIFIPTGNEIVSKERWLSEEKIDAGLVVDSNSEYAASIFSVWGYPLDVGPILPDDPDTIAGAVSRAVSEYDLVLLSAGSAKGRRDHSADIFSRLGRMIFRYVRMKPGRPAMAAVIEGTPVVCSPGFPMSCAVTLWSLVYPLLKRLSGARNGIDDISEAIGSAVTTEAKFMVHHSSPAGVAEWLRLKCADVEGNLFCWPLSAGASVLWALAESDGIAFLPEKTLEQPRGARVTVRLTRHVDFSKRMLFQGSDDPAVALLVSLVRQRGMDFAIRTVGSMGGLAALGRGEAHLAAAHLLDPANGTYNTSFIERFAEGRKWRRKLIFRREQGLIVARDNPKGVRGFSDLASGGIIFENRQPGAGTRVLFDFMLSQNGLTPSVVPGYNRISITHMEAANKVASGVADATLGIKAAADALGLDFIPIAHEPYELVFSERFDEHPASEIFMETLESGEWKRTVLKMGGYEWP